MSDKVREALDTALSLIGEIMSYSTFSVAFHPDLVERAEEFIAPFDQHGIDKIFPLTQPQPEAREEDNFEAVLQTCADYCRLGADGHLHMQRQPIEEALKRWALSRLAAKEGQGMSDIDAIRKALEAYADPNNWTTDDTSSAYRVWLEPDSSTPTAYDGYDLAQKAIVEAVDCAYRHVEPAAPVTDKKPEEKR